MSLFKSKLVLEDDRGFPMILFAPLVYQSDLAGTITVPAGFETDLASIPRGLWNVLPKVGPWDKAAVIHDWCYVTAPGGMSKQRADAILNEAMIVCNVPTWQRWIIWSGVVVGGSKIWRTYREADRVTT